MAGNRQDALAAEVLHEIRQPLLGLKAWLQMAKEDPAHAVPIDLLLSQVDRIEQILSDFQRLTHDKPAPKERVKLSTIARNAIAQSMRPGISTSAVELQVVFDVEVNGSPRLLEQLALNLVNNARDAAGPGGRVKVVVSREGVKPALLVADWGKGIAGGMREKIFEPFITTKDAGTGLGLVVCRRIAAEHQATLELALPSVVGDTPPPATVFRVVFDTENASATPARKSRILVVDDEAVIRLMFKDLLGREHEVIDAATGEQALDALKNAGPFDLVLADKNLPGFSGLDLALEVKNHWPALKFMLMTGYPSLVTAQQSVELGLIDYLTKPFDDIKVVREKVRAALIAPIPAQRKTSNKRVDVYEDNPLSARQICDALALLGMTPNVITQMVAGGADVPAAVVVSWDFTPAQGIAAIALAKQHAPGAPFVVLAEHLTMDSAIESLRAGASACLPKLLSDVKALSRELQRALKLP